MYDTTLTPSPQKEQEKTPLISKEETLKKTILCIQFK